MPTVVGVTFRSAGQVYQFDPGGLELGEGDAVIASTQRGMELGEVAVEAREAPEQEIEQPLRRIKRKATEQDLRREDENRELERSAFDACAEKIQKHGLPMKLIEAHYIFDRSRIVFYFSAEGRVDFRRLVRDLASELKTRVELHQVGVRDEAKFFGGFGPCGRPLCCATFLSTLHPVAIKMAKEQNLALNPLKISGVCGRLMCCLNFEYECYRQAKAELPRVGAEIAVPQGRGKVAEVHVLKRSVTVALEDGTRVEVDPQCAGQTRAAEAREAPAAPAPQPSGKDKPRPRRRSRHGRRRKPKQGEGQSQ